MTTLTRWRCSHCVAFQAMLRWPAAKSAALVTGACAVSSVCMPELSGHHDAVAAIDGRC